MNEQKMQDLKRQDAEELTPEQAEEAHGGLRQSIEADRLTSSTSLRSGAIRNSLEF
jgi:hypothetical protein